MAPGEPPSREELEAAHCWEPGDRVPGQPEMTAFRQRARLHNARWREAHGHPIGTQPIAPRPGDPKARPVGSRLPLDYARDTGATFLTPGALAAARARTSTKEPRQSFDQQRLWADLLWAPTVPFNLFGDLAADLALADSAVHTWWPGTPGTVVDVRFVHSPGWLDAEYTGSLVPFDAAFVLDRGDGTRGILGVAVGYHEPVRRGEAKPTRAARYLGIAERSGAFPPGAAETVDGTDLLVLWLQHLLVHSMLQHPGGEWAWGALAVVHPAANTSVADACRRYEALLSHRSTFSSSTLEALLAARALPSGTADAFVERYLPIADLPSAP